MQLPESNLQEEQISNYIKTTITDFSGAVSPLVREGIIKSINKISSFDIVASGIEINAKKEVGWAYINVPENIKKTMKKLRDKIDPEDVGEDGIEDEPHITVKYGLVTKDPEEVKEIVKNNKGGVVTMGKTSLFENEDADVLKISVSSPALTALWKSLSKLENEDKYDKYLAHATLAYLKPGTGKKYNNMKDLDGKEFTFDEFFFQDLNDVETKIKLNKADIKKTAQFDDFDVLDSEIENEFEISFNSKLNQNKQYNPSLSEAYMIQYNAGIVWDFVAFKKRGSRQSTKTYPTKEAAQEDLINHYTKRFPKEEFRIVKVKFAIWYSNVGDVSLTLMDDNNKQILFDNLQNVENAILELKKLNKSDVYFTPVIIEEPIIGQTNASIKTAQFDIIVKSSETINREYPISAAIIANGKIFEGRTHAEALNKAVDLGYISIDEDGQVLDKNGNILNYDGSLDLFMTNKGRLVNRFQTFLSNEATGAENIPENERDDLDSLLKRHADLGVDAFVSERNNGSLFINTLRVDKDKRKNGLGTTFMKDLCTYADRRGKDIELNLGDRTPGETTSKTRLIDFYKRFGFVRNFGRTSDYARSCQMYRKPRKIFQKQTNVVDKTSSSIKTAQFDDFDVLDSESEADQNLEIKKGEIEFFYIQRRLMDGWVKLNTTTSFTTEEKAREYINLYGIRYPEIFRVVSTKKGVLPNPPLYVVESLRVGGHWFKIDSIPSLSKIYIKKAYADLAIEEFQRRHPRLKTKLRSVNISNQFNHLPTLDSANEDIPHDFGEDEAKEMAFNLEFEKT